MIAHIQHRGPRAAPIINQGLLQSGIDFQTDTPYISLGKKIVEKCDNIRDVANESSLIFVGRRGDHESWISKDNLWGKVIWYDFEDYCTYDPDIVKKSLLYVKRSVVTQNRQLIKLDVGSKKIIPIDYCVLDEYLGHQSERQYSVACLFGERNRLGIRRNNIKQALKDANFANAFIGTTCSPSNYGSHARNAIKHDAQDNCFLDYMKVLGSSKVVVSAYPQNHDGDCRTWEAMASGALVVLDTCYIPTNHKLEDNYHILRYNAESMLDISRVIKRIDELLKDDYAREKIANNGYEYAIRHHRPVNRLQYIVDNLPEPFLI